MSGEAGGRVKVRSAANYELLTAPSSAYRLLLTCHLQSWRTRGGGEVVSIKVTEHLLVYTVPKEGIKIGCVFQWAGGREGDGCIN